MDREKKDSENETGTRKCARIDRGTLIIAGITVILAVILCRVFLFVWAERVVRTYRHAWNELTLQDGLQWPKPWYCATGHRVKDPANNFVKIHDARGFTPITRPVDLLESETSGFEDPSVRKLIVDFLAQPSLAKRGETARRTKKVKLTVGDSNIHINPSIPIKGLNRDVHWMDSIGIAGKGPGFYHAAVERWLIPGGTIDKLLRENSVLCLEVDVAISAQNDLENLRRNGQENPPESRLVFPHSTAGGGRQSTRDGGASFRTRFAPVVRKLFTIITPPI